MSDKTKTPIADDLLKRFVPENPKPFFHEARQKVAELEIKIKDYENLIKQLATAAECAKERWYEGAKNTLHDSHEIADMIEKAIRKAGKIIP